MTNVIKVNVAGTYVNLTNCIVKMVKMCYSYGLVAWVRWLDELEIRLNSVQLGWNVIAAVTNVIRVNVPDILHLLKMAKKPTFKAEILLIWTIVARTNVAGTNLTMRKVVAKADFEVWSKSGQ